MRVHTGAGYRIYFIQRRQIVLILLCGGSKSTQTQDIRRAKRLAKELQG
jgi:putative addiction module killer protein